MKCDLCKGTSKDWWTLDGWVFCAKCFNMLKDNILNFYCTHVEGNNVPM